VGLADWDRKADAVKGDGDPSNVEIWHARDLNVISEQKLRIARDRDRNALAAWNLEANKLVALSTNPKENVQLPRQGNRALAVDESPYETDGMFGRRYADIYKVDVATGARTEVVRRLVPPVWFSPGGRYALNFLDGEYTIYDLENGTQRNVSKEARVNFTNRYNDYPVRHKPSYGVAGWTKDDESEQTLRRVLLVGAEDDRIDGPSLGGKRPQVEAGGRGGQLHVPLLRPEREGHLARWKAANDVTEQPAGKEDRTLALDLDLLEHHRQPELHVGGAQREARARGVELDTAE
jgi:hypothetical protein